jgi:hypothetical protein
VGTEGVQRREGNRWGRSEIETEEKERTEGAMGRMGD